MLKRVIRLLCVYELCFFWGIAKRTKKDLVQMSDLRESLKQVAVIGAGGKMGAGITLLLLILMASQKDRCHLQAIDTNEKALEGLKKYLRQQLTRYAEKNINHLRKSYANDPHIVSNEEVIEAFVIETFDCIDFSTHLEAVEGSFLIFEAAIENIEAKASIFKRVKAVNGDKAWILTNTSSIPVSLLNERAALNNRIIGFHFYNPPPVQKLVEVIEMPENPPEFKQLAKDLGTALNKTLIYSNDIAGFIGNGYFMREILFTFHFWDRLGKTDLALQQLESVTRNFLLRPMGIFQLMDYVGLDVVRNILSIMSIALPDDSFETVWIDKWLDAGIKGGQTFDGEQKDGIFAYENGKPKAVFSLDQKRYISLVEDLQLGKPPFELSWKSVSKDPKKDETIDRYLAALAGEDTLGAKYATKYLKEGKKIANYLTSSHVAHSIEDVATVLKNGFYHLYGPRNEF